MFIEIHILQNFSPSNLNRDDTGNPKDTDFGGVRRARISSQCIKRAIRSEKIFSETTQVESGVRTRWMNRQLAESLVSAGKDEQQAQDVAKAMAAQYIKMNKDHTSVLLYLSKQEVNSIQARLLQEWDQVLPNLKDGKSPLIDQIAKDLFKKNKNRTGAPDIALFGRMLTNKPDFNIDAACQVAHAISTHRVNMELDFFTAVDELSQDNESGAGMMGVIAFNSACFYRYARIDWNLLLKNLDGDEELARRTVEGFLLSSLKAIPTGKQNSFAAQNPPDFVLGVLRQDGESWSLANAFEKPISSDKEGGYLLKSIAALDQYWGRLVKVYGDGNLNTAVLSLDENVVLTHLKDSVKENRKDWVTSLMTNLR